MGEPFALHRGRAPRVRPLAVVLGGIFLAGLDTYIVTLALPTIGDDLDIGLAALGWVLLAYLLAIGGSVIAVGRAADVWGTRVVFSLGAGIFTLGAAFAGLAPAFVWLVVARAVQGLGAAMLLAAGQAAVADLFDERQRGRALAAQHVAASVGFAAGPALGGLLIETIGWRSVFLVHLPLGALVALGALWLLPPHRPHARRSLDVSGAVLLVAGLVALLFGIQNGPQRGWLVPETVASVGVGSALLGAFVVAQRRSREPMVDFTLFQLPAFRTGLAVALLTFVAMASNMFLVPFMLQGPVGLDARAAGWVMLAVPLTILGAAPLGGWLADRVGSRLPTTLGLGLVTAAVAALALTAAGPPLAVAAALISYGVGAGLFQAPNNSRVLGAVAAPQRGLASGTLVMTRQLGQLLGVALASAIWTARGAAHRAALPADQTEVLAFRDTLLVLATAAALAAVLSWAGERRTATGGRTGHLSRQPRDKNRRRGL